MTRPLLWLGAGFLGLALVVVLLAPPALRGPSLLLPLVAALPVAVVLGGLALKRRASERDAAADGVAGGEAREARRG